MTQPTQKDLEYVFRLKYGEPIETGWSPRLRLRFGYFTPDEYYEALVANLVAEETSWLDVGCGRAMFPNNYPLDRVLANRCKLLVGVDPDETIEENPFVHEGIRECIESFCSHQSFDVITLRMVAEHIINPAATVKSLARLTKPGGQVVIYTIYKWSPIPILTRLIPFSLHQPVKHLLWGTEAKDTFPITYHMNTRKCLKNIFQVNGFEEQYFAYLDDSRIFWRFHLLHFLELSLLSTLNAMGLSYPERCILAIYERQASN